MDGYFNNLIIRYLDRTIRIMSTRNKVKQDERLREYEKCKKCIICN